MSLGKPSRTAFSSAADSADDGETRSGLLWSMAEFATLAAVALAAGLIIFYVRWPTRSTQTAVMETKGDPVQLHAPVAADRVVLEFATNDDLQRVSDFQNVRELLIEDSRITDEGLAHLRKLTELEHLKIRGAAISDAGIANVCKLAKLRFLNLPQASFTNAGLKQLARLPQLEMLRFGSPNVTDEGMVEVARMPRLRFLHLINVPLTDGGLDQLQPVTRLKSLYLDGSQVTDLGLTRLLDAIPELHIHIDQRHIDIDPRAASQARYVP